MKLRAFRGWVADGFAKARAFAGWIASRGEAERPTIVFPGAEIVTRWRSRIVGHWESTIEEPRYVAKVIVEEKASITDYRWDVAIKPRHEAELRP